MFPLHTRAPRMPPCCFAFMAMWQVSSFWGAACIHWLCFRKSLIFLFCLMSTFEVGQLKQGCKKVSLITVSVPSWFYHQMLLLFFLLIISFPLCNHFFNIVSSHWYFNAFFFFWLIWHFVSSGTGSSIFSALQDLPLALWPCRSKMEKHLQVFSVLQWVISFLALGKWVNVLMCGCPCAFFLSCKRVKKPRRLSL